MTAADSRRWYALCLLCVAGFMVILDAQIVVLALPSIADGLGFSASGAQWVMSAYLLSFGGLLLLGGRVADLLGRRRVFMTGTLLFGLSSLLCGFAGTAAVLVGARAVQGVSAAVMAPTALSILLNTFEEGPERNKALALWSGSGGFGATAALLIGGPLTDVLGWQWVFFLNAPVALAMLVLSPLLLRESRTEARTRSFDPIGALTATGALVACVYAVVEAPRAGWLSPRTTGLLALAVVLALVFLRTESKAAAPLVPLRLLRSRTVSGANLVVFLLGATAFGMSYTLSQYGQGVLGWSPLRFGLANVVMPLGAVVGSYAGQALVTRIGARPVAVGGLSLSALAALLLSGVPVGGGFLRDLLPALLLFGPGVGACAVAGSIAALTGVGERDSGVASGIQTAAFQIGGAFGVAVVTSASVSHTVGTERLAALTAGYQAAFTACVALAVAGIGCALVLLRAPRSRTAEPLPKADVARRRVRS
ncbi:EmrB/QacA subfamily drug resistance transporter [Streptomyces sp. SAI-144]|uniref:MFS transporter n=1 Tax=Streptomyces sp. SAI-144 TaxID=2940544 RepID=UPI002475B5B0|nr:MFS transporter [Streptomyces sp. SAI-144]MDH6432047.1 EmrB/QacA subfamily drug resistance transporter [Streptomyces sp. SAI-144]